MDTKVDERGHTPTPDYPLTPWRVFDVTPERKSGDIAIDDAENMRVMRCAGTAYYRMLLPRIVEAVNSYHVLKEENERWRWTAKAHAGVSAELQSEIEAVQAENEQLRSAAISTQERLADLPRWIEDATGYKALAAVVTECLSDLALACRNDEARAALSREGKQ